MAFEVVFCGAVQLAGTVSSTTPFAASPPVVAVYVATSVLLVVAASAAVGATVPVPEPSAELLTATVCVPPPTPTVVSAPPFVDFALIVKMELPAFAAPGAAAAPPALTLVSPYVTTTV